MSHKTISRIRTIGLFLQQSTLMVLKTGHKTSSSIKITRWRIFSLHSSHIKAFHTSFRREITLLDLIEPCRFLLPRISTLNQLLAQETETDKERGNENTIFQTILLIFSYYFQNVKLKLFVKLFISTYG